MTRSTGARVVETVATSAAGAVLAGAAGSWLGLGRAFAVVGASNGALSGWRGVYSWRSARGVAAFTLDSTWSLATTAGALCSHVIAVVRRHPGYDASLSERQDRHVYRRGFQPRRRFLITVGNVVSGAGDTSSAARRRTVTDHEDVHVWQARWLGPAYPVLYAGWMMLGGAVGVVVWARRHRDLPVGKVVETVAYYLNPFEWWAYSRAGNWPPTGKLAGLGWRRPVVSARVGREGTRATPR